MKAYQQLAQEETCEIVLFSTNQEHNRDLFPQTSFLCVEIDFFKVETTSNYYNSVHVLLLWMSLLCLLKSWIFFIVTESLSILCR